MRQEMFELKSISLLTINFRYGPSHDVIDYIDDEYQDISVTATVTSDECGWGSGWLGWIFCMF